MKAQRVLLTLVPDRRADLDHARRRIAYHRLILAAGPERRALAQDVADEENSTAPGATPIAETLSLPPHDPMAAHAVLTAAVRRARPDTVILNAAGGTTAQLLAMMLVAYHEALETVFVQAGRVDRLPVLQGTDLPRWFPADEARMMHELSQDGTVATLPMRLGRGRAHTERTLRSLTKKALLVVRPQAGAAHATPTDTGRLVLRHLSLPPERSP